MLLFTIFNSVFELSFVIYDSLGVFYWKYITLENWFGGSGEIFGGLRRGRSPSKDLRVVQPKLCYD